MIVACAFCTFAFLSMLAQLGLLTQGSVQDRTARKGGGAGYQWTRKVARKTVTVALTEEQFANRQLRLQLGKMESLFRRIIFKSTPRPGRHKWLTRQGLGIN
jgi:hypothetical protein